ncbi:uncharacterized protein JCM6883_000172 [Sporobolomyces salmoneus]|uniref:uncharacterized protein n=1 Tax=Sporobolomyces salmoneus TaxID=183962 RepID=UPI0031732FBF
MLPKLLALVFLLFTVTCNAERFAPHRLGSLSNGSTTEGAALGDHSSGANAQVTNATHEKRQTGAPPKEDVGTSNPVAKPQNLNNRGDSAPLSGKAGGAMAPFKKRSEGSNEFEFSSFLGKRSPHPVPHPSQLNEITHLLATRGLPDGTIEYF